MKTKRVAIILLVLALVVGAEALLMSSLTGSGGNGPAATPQPSASAAPTDEPAAATPTAPPAMTSTFRPGFTSPPNSVGNNASPTRAPATNAPEPTRAPATATPKPTAPPTDPPPSERVTASNSFSSYTGVGLNMSVSWTATDLGDGTTRLSISGTVNSYALDVMSLPVNISFSGYSRSLMGNSISVGDGLHSNGLFSTSLDVPTGTSGTMTVTWNYNGTYSGTEIADVTASDFVYTN